MSWNPKGVQSSPTRDICDVCQKLTDNDYTNRWVYVGDNADNTWDICESCRDSFPKIYQDALSFYQSKRNQ